MRKHERMYVASLCKFRQVSKTALTISGVIIFGPAEEKTATSGAGLVFRTVVVGQILAMQICNHNVISINLLARMIFY